MANKGFFDKIASFEEAMRKFEEALEQSQDPESRRPTTQPLNPIFGQGPTPTQPWDNQPQRPPRPSRPPQSGPRPAAGRSDQGWGRPNEEPGYLVIDDPTQGRYGSGEGESLERAEWLRRMASALGDRTGQTDSEGQPDDEGRPSEGLAGPERPDAVREGLSSEGDDDKLSSLSTLSFTQGTGSQPDNAAWWNDPDTGAVTHVHALPPALAHLDRYANPVVQGVIWAELLGKPISRRRGRGRNGL